MEIAPPKPVATPAADPFVALRRRHIDMHATNICRVLSDGRMGCWDFPAKGAWVLPGESRFVSVSSHLNLPHGLTEDGIMVEWSQEEGGLFVEQLSMAGLRQDQAGGQNSVYLTERGQVFYTFMTFGLGRRQRGLDDIVFISRGSGSFAAIDGDGVLHAFSVFQASYSMAGVNVGTEPARLPLGGKVTFAELSSAFGCAVVERRVRCWTKEAAYDIAVPPAVRVSMSNQQGCALTATSQVWCWPFDDNQMGVREELRRVDLPPKMLDVAVKRYGRSACAVTRDDTFCWGERFGTAPRRMERPSTVFQPSEPEEAFDSEEAF